MVLVVGFYANFCDGTAESVFRLESAKSPEDDRRKQQLLVEQVVRNIVWVMFSKSNGGCGMGIRGGTVPLFMMSFHRLSEKLGSATMVGRRI